jgi:hypothetical protein
MVFQSAWMWRCRSPHAASAFHCSLDVFIDLDVLRLRHLSRLTRRVSDAVATAIDWWTTCAHIRVIAVNVILVHHKNILVRYSIKFPCARGIFASATTANDNTDSIQAT